MKLALSVVLVLAGLALIGGVAVYSGLYNVAATESHGPLVETLLQSAMRRSVARHASALVAPDSFDEESVFREKVYVNSTPFYGLSIVMPFGPKNEDKEGGNGFNWAAVLQCQGHGNAFTRFDQYNSTPTTVHGGLRALIAGWFFEGAVGFGVTPTGSADYVVDFAAVRSF